MTTPTPAAPPKPPAPALPPSEPEKPRKEAPTLYVCPLAEYLAEVRRIAFGEGARWALDQHLRRVRAGEAIPEEVVSTAARDYAQRSR